MSLDAQGALGILKLHDEKLYNSLHEEHSGFIPFAVPLSTDKQAYWENQLKTKYPDAHDFYKAVRPKLDAFTFFVGLEVKSPKVQVMLANYDALKKLFEKLCGTLDTPKEKLERLGHTIRRYYDLAGDIFLSRLYVTWAKESVENVAAAKDFAFKATQSLGSAVLYGYGTVKHQAYCSYDPKLSMDKDLWLQELCQLNLLGKKDLSDQACMRGTTFAQLGY